jgi:hypothetical protein
MMTESNNNFYFDIDGKIIYSGLIKSVNEIDGTVEYEKPRVCLPCRGTGKRGPYQCNACRGQTFKGHTAAIGYTIKRLYELNRASGNKAYRNMKEMIQFNEEREASRIRQDWVVWEHSNSRLLNAIRKADSANNFLKSLLSQINQKRKLSFKQIEVAKKILEIN